MTESWEFLIQQEGDRAWLPLESPSVEILEGRYRVVARSSRRQTPVEIRLVHQSLQEEPPKRRVQKRMHRTNQDGLMVVFPYTYLKPGLWEVSCTGDILSDLLGNTWKYSIELEVLPVESEGGVTPDSPLGEPSETASEIPLESATDSDQALGDFADTPSVPEVKEPPILENLPIPVTITLTQTVFLTLQAQPVVIGGQIELLEGECPVPFRQYQLKILLHDPQNFQVLKELEQTLPSQPFPIPFEYHLDLPVDCPRLIVGEVQVWDVTLQFAEPVATQDFTLAAGVNELLAEVNQQLQAQIEEEAVEESSESSEFANSPSEPVNLFFFNLINEPKEKHQIDLKVAPKSPLPPLIYRREPSESKVKSPELPSFFKRKVEEVPVVEAASSEPISEELKAEVSGEEELEISPEISTSEPTEAVTNEKIEIPTVQPPVVPRDPIFSRLKLHERFAARLNAIAREAAVVSPDPEMVPSETEAVVSPEEVTSELETPPAERNLPVPVEPPALTFATTDWEAQEIVAEDESVNDEGIIPQNGENSSTLSPEVSVEPLPARDWLKVISTMGAVEPLPTPRLEVPPGDWTAGQPIPVIVKLPQSLSRLRVKIWMRDRQMRSLLEEPRWLGEFESNTTSELEAKTEFTIPYGCMEVELEAIAVEITTGRESHKITLDRMVIPPDLLDLSLDELNLG